MGLLHLPTRTDAVVTVAPVAALVIVYCQGPGGTEPSEAALQMIRLPSVSLVKVAVVVDPAVTVTVTEPVVRDGDPTRAEVGATVMESTVSGVANVSVIL